MIVLIPASDLIALMREARERRAARPKPRPPAGR